MLDNHAGLQVYSKLSKTVVRLETDKCFYAKPEQRLFWLVLTNWFCCDNLVVGGVFQVRYDKYCYLTVMHALLFTVQPLFEKVPCDVTVKGVCLKWSLSYYEWEWMQLSTCRRLHDDWKVMRVPRLYSSTPQHVCYEHGWPSMPLVQCLSVILLCLHADRGTKGTKSGNEFNTHL